MIFSRPNLLDLNRVITCYVFFNFPAKCNQVINISNSTELNVDGFQSNKYIPIELCKWNLNVNAGKNLTTRLSVSSFKFGKNKTCIESMITLHSRDKKRNPVFFYCNQVQPTPEGKTFLIQDGEFTLEFLRSNWQPGDGMTLRFEIQE